MASLLESIINHVALPPKLPGQAEENLNEIEQELVTGLVSASRVLQDAIPTDDFQRWDSTRRMLQTCKELNSGGRLNKSSLLRNFRQLEAGDVLILHIIEQNAGLLIQRTSK